MVSYLEYLRNAKKQKITENFTMFEVCNSENAIKLGIDNRPESTKVIINATELIKNVLQPTRNHFNKPLDVSCMYRCPKLNNHKIIGGATNSQHLDGQAADFTIRNVTLISIIDYIRNNLDFDQLILEPGWIHVSYKSKGNRKQVLRFDGRSYKAI